MENGKSYACVTDQIGTPRELISSNGEVAWSAQFTAWGEIESIEETQTDCPIRFQGQWHDEESGLHYNRFRYYDTESVSYFSPDPIGFSGGPRARGYVQNPIAWVDPLGLVSTWNPSGAASKGYPGIGATPNGGPDFTGTPYLYPTTGDQQSIFQIQMQGTRGRDFTQAYKEAGISESDADGYTWHHVDDFNPETGTTTMQLVESDAHRATYLHEGSVKQFSDEFGVPYDDQAAVKVSQEKGWLKEQPARDNQTDFMKNTFRKAGRPLSLQDIADVEHALEVKIPDEVKNHYLEYNGGIPERDLWSPEPDQGEIWIGSFIPMKYPTRRDNTMERIYRAGIDEGYLFGGLIPFAEDRGGNFICFNQLGEVYFCAMDIWDSKLSKQENERRVIRPVTHSFANFVEQLVPYRSAEWTNE